MKRRRLLAFGILPGDLPQEIDRVRREVRFIENEALAQWQALTPPTLTGQPPTLANTGMRANQLLGKLMNFDEHMLTLVADLHSLSLTNSTCLAA
jgi:hypothetical protein